MGTMTIKTILLAIAAFLLILYWTTRGDSEESSPAGELSSNGSAPRAGKSRSGRLTQNPLSPVPPVNRRDDRPARLPAKSHAKREGPIPEEDQIAGLIFESLHGTETEDRAFAVSELGLFDPTPEVISACFQALGDPEDEVRMEAVLALESLEDPAALPVLRRVAKEDTSESVREAATEAVDSLMNP